MKAWLLCLVLMLCTSLALAQEPLNALQKSVVQLLSQRVIEPLRKIEHKRSRFSRGAPVAVQRRTRVLDAVALVDARGRQFVRFAIDEQRPYEEDTPWEKNVYVGCVYVQARTIHVQQRGRLGALRDVHTATGDDCQPAPSVELAAAQ